MANNSSAGVLGNIGRSIGNALAGAGTYTAQAAARANGISFASQAAQGQFNQQSANIANSLADSRIFDQYAYNSAQAAEANNFTQMMWDKAAAYNTNMFERQMAFNAEQAQINRDFQKQMDSTKYQRAIKDMSKAGLNPILAVTGGGVSAGSAGGSTASVSSPSMGGASGISASGGLLNGISASEGNFSGQMEYMSGILGLISACMSGFSSAFGSLGSLGDLGEGLGNALLKAFTDKSTDNTKTTSDIGYNLGKSIHDKVVNYWNSGEQRKIEYYKNKYPGHGGNGYSR